MSSLLIEPLSDALGSASEKETAAMMRLALRKNTVVAAALVATLVCWAGQAAQPEKPARRQPVVVAQAIDSEVLRVTGQESPGFS